MPLHLGFWIRITNVRYMTWKIFQNTCTRSYKKKSSCIRYNKQPKITLSGWKLRMIFRRGTWLFRQRKGKSKQYSQEGHERGLQICKGIAQEFKKPFPAVFRRLFNLWAGSLLFWVSLTTQPPTISSAAAYGKKLLKPLVLPYTLVRLLLTYFYPFLSPSVQHSIHSAYCGFSVLC